jgi:hypothetical protein
VVTLLIVESGKIRNYMSDDSIKIIGNRFETIIAPAIPAQSDDIVVHDEPRISANKLAEYVIADPSRQKAIIRDCKFVKKVMVLPYKRTRAFIPHSFATDSLDIDKLVRRAKEIELENEAKGLSDWQRHDNSNSALALQKVAALAPDLSWKDAHILHGRLGGLTFAGVKVSIQPEVVFSFQHRNISKVGAIILNTAKDDKKSLARNNGASCVGDYLSSLLFQMLLSGSYRIGAPLNSKCYALDVFREKIYTAPASYRKLNKNLEAACEVIASRWSEIKFED